MFDSYINNLYDIKSNHINACVKQTAKLLVNSFLGRFGLDINRDITDLVDEKQLDRIVVTRRAISEKEIDKNLTLLTSNPEIDPDICKEFGIDVAKAVEDKLLKIKKNTKSSYNHVSVAIAAAVTAYGRIHINRIKKGIIELGGQIYYSDTDSIVTDLELPKNKVSNHIGNLKLEYKISKAYFISNKIYCLILNNKETVIKAKGVDRHSLTVQAFTTAVCVSVNLIELHENCLIWSKFSL